MRTIRPLELDAEDERKLWTKLYNQVRRVDGPLSTPCWIVSGSDDGKGYKKMRHNGRWLYKHRVMWTAVNGRIADGLVLDHKCRCRACINPDHLEPVTVVVNTSRGNGAWMLEKRRFDKNRIQG